MDEWVVRRYTDEECQVCGQHVGSRLCDDCKEETEILFKALCLENFNPEQLLYLDGRLDGVYLTDFVKGE